MLASPDWNSIVYNVLHVGMAFLLALPSAWNREQNTRIMGLRTYPLVSMGACAFALIGLKFIGPDGIGAKARVMQGLLSGLGFIGGGAILKGDEAVKGTASAATIWVTGAIGLAVAYDVWELAILMAISNFLVLKFLTPVKDEIADSKDS